ncbi:phytanoyl-CoA dioxygenase [Erythrobacter arachoides]|uniref:Phytanoyl-CoA dioxygenase n=1 Tax=Aurantiacibacter arachoides TaxID=1850444 RepID=A0A845A1J1_9SPHN|nr:phytanoyl-CoA dioxygenase family protein [Aurantiacibacter arachoides]MXO93332.1 phytanoyl-CoA dioxygenase [Aurantiacibacter arachoides]
MLPELRVLAEGIGSSLAGVRLHGHAGLEALLRPERAVGSLAVALLGDRARPVRAILFDKRPGMNWGLAWHQDRTICVERKVETDGFGPWTMKQGIHHVAPPMTVLERMVTLRIHIDDVPATNAPLLVALGSHRLGLVPEPEIERVVERHTVVECLARAGDVWAYATPILHASRSASGAVSRRVLQVDFSAVELPGELMWLSI